MYPAAVLSNASAINAHITRVLEKASDHDLCQAYGGCSREACRIVRSKCDVVGNRMVGQGKVGRHRRSRSCQFAKPSPSATSRGVTFFNITSLADGSPRSSSSS